MIRIKPLIISVGGPLGGFKISRYLTRSTPKILMYHRFSEMPEKNHMDRQTFERQLLYLTRHFNLYSLSQLVDHYNAHGIFPDNAVVITVDDGYQDFIDVAASELNKFSVPATFFVTTQFVDGDFWLWPDSIKYILGHSQKLDLSQLQGHLVDKCSELTESTRTVFWEKIVAYLLSIDELDKRQWIKSFAEFQNVELPRQPPQEFAATTWEQLRELQLTGIEVGVHTQSHPSLGHVNEEGLNVEIIEATNYISKKLGIQPKSFCYPNGQPSDYTEQVKDFVKKSGCKAAVTAFYDKNLIDDIYELRRYNVSTDWMEFLKAVNGVKQIMSQQFGDHNIIAGKY